MNNIIYHKIKQLAQQRLVWILLLSVFLSYSTISLVHAQKHTLVHDHQCKVCLTSFNHAPFILSDHLSFIPVIQDSFIVEQAYISIITTFKLITGNRGPPRK